MPLIWWVWIYITYIWTSTYWNHDHLYKPTLRPRIVSYSIWLIGCLFDSLFGRSVTQCYVPRMFGGLLAGLACCLPCRWHTQTHIQVFIIYSTNKCGAHMQIYSNTYTHIYIYMHFDSVHIMQFIRAFSISPSCHMCHWFSCLASFLHFLYRFSDIVIVNSCLSNGCQ